MNTRKHILQWWPGLSLDSALTILVMIIGGVFLFATTARSVTALEDDVAANVVETAAVETRAVAAVSATRADLLRIEGKVDQLLIAGGIRNRGDGGP